MAQTAEAALADIEAGEDKAFKRCIKRLPHGVVCLWWRPGTTPI